MLKPTHLVVRSKKNAKANVGLLVSLPLQPWVWIGKNRKGINCLFTIQKILKRDHF